MNPEALALTNTIGVPITAAFAALVVLLLTATAMNTTRVRFATSGRYEDPAVRERVRRASRAHGNSFEHCIPIVLLMMFYELQGGSPNVLCTLGVVLLATRLLYIWGMLAKPGGKMMQAGAGFTYLLELGWVGLVLCAVYGT